MEMGAMDPLWIAEVVLVLIMFGITLLVELNPFDFGSVNIGNSLKVLGSYYDSTAVLRCSSRTLLIRV